MIPHLEINSLCISCDNCFLICPEHAVLKFNNEYTIATSACTLCNACIEVCPVDCIKYIKNQDDDSL